MTNGTHEDEEYTVAQAAEALRVTPRQVQRHAANGRVRSRHEGRRLLLHRGDVDALARELGAEHRPDPPQEGEIVAEVGPVMDYVRELTGQLLMMSRRVGELEGQLQNRLLPADEANLRQELAAYEARVKALEEELERARRPWWRRLFG